MLRSVPLLIISGLCLFSGCNAPEVPDSQPQASTHAPRLTSTEQDLAVLFALADVVLTGTLVIEESDTRFDPARVNIWSIHIDANHILVGGHGVAVSEESFRRVLDLRGRVVTAGVVAVSGGWKSVVGDGRRLCIAPEDEVQNLQSIRTQLEADPRWHSDALAGETGDFARFLSRLPTQEGSWIDGEVREVLVVNYARATDILGWYARTVDHELDRLPSLRLRDATGSFEFDDSRRLASFVMETAFGLRTGSIVRRNWEGRERCRRLWLLWKLVGIANGQVHMPRVPSALSERR